jgi:hypothetical protein
MFSKIKWFAFHKTFSCPAQLYQHRVLDLHNREWGLVLQKISVGLIVKLWSLQNPFAYL